MKKYQDITIVLVLLFLIVNSVFLYKAVVGIGELNQKIEEIELQIESAKKVIAEPVELIQSIASGVVSSPDEGAPQDGLTRDEKFRGYFEKIRTSGHTFYREGKVRTPDSMADKLESKYGTLSMLIQDDEKLLRTITQSTGTEGLSLVMTPYEVEADGKKQDLMMWLAGGK